MLGVERLGRALVVGRLERLVVPDVAARPASRTSLPVCWTTTIVSSDVRSPITSSTCCLIGAVLPLRRAPSTVISALASENSMRSLTDSGEKPPKTTLCGAPMRAQASIATTTSGIIGR